MDALDHVSRTLLDRQAERLSFGRESLVWMDALDHVGRTLLSSWLAGRR
jgi:hypothetical protein